MELLYVKRQMIHILIALIFPSSEAVNVDDLSADKSLALIGSSTR
jgi:hypothetical protein